MRMRRRFWTRSEGKRNPLLVEAIWILGVGVGWEFYSKGHMQWQRRPTSWDLFHMDLAFNCGSQRQPPRREWPNLGGEGEVAEMDLNNSIYWFQEQPTPRFLLYLPPLIPILMVVFDIFSTTLTFLINSCPFSQAMQSIWPFLLLLPLEYPKARLFVTESLQRLDSTDHTFQTQMDSFWPMRRTSNIHEASTFPLENS